MLETNLRGNTTMLCRCTSVLLCKFINWYKVLMGKWKRYFFQKKNAFISLLLFTGSVFIFLKSSVLFCIQGSGTQMWVGEALVVKHRWCKLQWIGKFSLCLKILKFNFMQAKQNISLRCIESMKLLVHSLVKMLSIH